MAIDIVVAGCGPVGALLAAELRLAGAQVLVLERAAEPTRHSRAFRLQTRTLELLEIRGLLDEFVADGTRLPKTHFAGVRPLLDLDLLDSEFPYALGIPQAKTERHLERHARELGAEIRRGHEVAGLRQNPDSVDVTVHGPDGEYVVPARYLVGCDGGRSRVRKLAAIDFPGTPGKVAALLGDVTLADPSAFPSGIPGTLRTSGGMLMAVPHPGGVRVLTAEFGRELPDRDEPVTLAELAASVERIAGKRIALSDPTWLARFNDGTRLAGQYQKGRVLLAGDAAHVHFPIGAQGLNLGLQDAMNLGWKLAAELRGWAPPWLLASYDLERRPAARTVIRETRAQLALMNPDEAIDPVRELIGGLLAVPEANLFICRLVTGIDLRYEMAGQPPHELLGTFVPPLAVRTLEGEVQLAPLLHLGKGVLLDLSGSNRFASIATGWGDRLTVLAGQGEGPSGLLIRPDGYVAWVAGDEDDLKRALTTWFG